MTVENWLRGHFQGIGTQIESQVLEAAALSPIEAQPTALRAVSLSDDVEDYYDDEAFLKGLRYALSTLYYSMSSAITGGTRSEKRGNRQVSIGGFALTTSDREAFRAMGDKLRSALGAEVEEDVSESGRMFDASMMRNPKRRAL